MSGKKKNLMYVSLFSILVLNTSTVLACGVCTTAVIDRLFPPIEMWIGLSICWFLIHEVILVLRGEKAIGSFVKVLLLIVGLILAGFIMLGPLGLFVLLLAALISTIRVLVPSLQPNWSPKSVRDIRIVGVIGLLTIFVLSSYSFVVKQSWSEAAYIVKWAHTSPGRIALRRLVKQGSETLPDLQVIGTQGTEEHLVMVVEEIKNDGEATLFVPFLIDMLETARIRKFDNSVVENVEEALRTLSKVDLPKGTSSKTWRDTWEEK